MYTLSVIGFSICLVYISITMQGAESKTCLTCTTDYAAAGGQCSAAETNVECAKDCTPSSGRSAVEQVAEKARTATCGAKAGTCSECKETYEDQGKTCSAADVYVACAEKDCTSFSEIFKLASAKAAPLTCGAGSILVNLTVIVLGLTFYTLF
ncbi:uncharacterized protein LOC143082136 [Mytilus galloprovincialis]|uniref:uncharacterized protein LOC143082136 n=1 Tax=Mytilus galloprovincialis TaxID=29158 RepID=UPI003F7BE24C